MIPFAYVNEIAVAVATAVKMYHPPRQNGEEKRRQHSVKIRFFITILYQTAVINYNLDITTKVAFQESDLGEVL